MGLTALMRAASFGHLEVVKCLCENKADQSIKNQIEFDSIMLAAKSGHIEVVKYFESRA